MNDQTGISSVEERRLSEWLRAGTPQPPGVLTAEAISAQASMRRPQHRWMPTLAAATIVVAVLAGVVFGVSWAEHGSAPPASPTISKPPFPSSPPPSTKPSPRSLPAHPWHAKQLGILPLTSNSTTVLDGRLFGEGGDGRSQTLYRLDPGTGKPLAHADHVYGGLQPVAAAGLIWVPSASTREVLGLNPVTLAVKTTVRAPVRTGIAAQGSDTVVVSDDHAVSFIRAGRVIHRLTIAHQVTSIAMSADGTRLYVAIELGSMPGPGQIETLDPRTGSPLAAPVRTSGVGLGLRATAGGIWYTSLSGMRAAIGFQPSGAHRPERAGDVGVSGGGALTFPSVSDGVAWLGSADQLGCADPDTGALRARVPVGSRQGMVIAAISGLAVLDGKVFAVYDGVNGGPANALIVMTPPSQCFGS